MPTPQITALPTPPSRTDPANFSARGDAFLGALPVFTTETNALATYLNDLTVEFVADNLSATSSSSFDLDATAKNLTISIGKAFSAGMLIKITDTTDNSKYLICTVTSYDKTTGALVASVNSVEGTGSIVTSNISLSAPVQSALNTGDVVFTSRTLSAPSYLLADGGFYNQASYATLYAELGLLRDGVMQPWVTGAVLGSGTFSPDTCAPVAHNGALYVYSWASSTSTHKLNRTTDGVTITGTASLTNTAAASAYLGVAAIGTTMLALPPSGNAWVSRSTDTGGTFVSQPVAGLTGQTRIMVIGGLFCIFGGTTAYWTSPDGLVWTSRTLPAALPQITLGNGIAIGATNTSTTTTYTTADGITWTARTMPVSQPWQAVDAYYNPASSVWLMWGGGGGAWARSTDNGATWSSATMFAGATITPANNGSFNSAVRVFNGRFIVYTQQTSSDAILSSVDGATWTAIECPPFDSFTPYTIHNAMWVLGSELYLGSGAILWQTSDGVSWRRVSTVQAQQQVGYWRYVAEIGGVQIAVYTSDNTLRRRPIYTYNSATQFAVPQVQAAPGVTAYIKA